MEGWNTRTMQCLCHNLDICSAYENWCSEQEDELYWNSLTQEEKDSFKMRLCNNCSRAFEPLDADGEQEVCHDCKDWLDDYEEFGINF